MPRRMASNSFTSGNYRDVYTPYKNGFIPFDTHLHRSGRNLFPCLANLVNQRQNPCHNESNFLEGKQNQNLTTGGKKSQSTRNGERERTKRKSSCMHPFYWHIHSLGSLFFRRFFSKILLPATHWLVRHPSRTPYLLRHNRSNNVLKSGSLRENAHHHHHHHHHHDNHKRQNKQTNGRRRRRR